ncbi:hypothetical protein A5728_10585 [Kocuria sp. ICS0012]|nr:hypothetical protein A5728_10585 [Kocuria sp. ICS0012]
MSFISSLTRKGEAHCSGQRAGHRRVQVLDFLLLLSMATGAFEGRDWRLRPCIQATEMNERMCHTVLFCQLSSVYQPSCSKSLLN